MTTRLRSSAVGYILALNLVLHFGDLLPTRAPLGPLFFAAVWGIVIMPILQFGQVLYPSRRRAEKELLAKTSCGSEQRVYYVDPDTFADLERLRPTGPKSDWTSVARRRIAQNISRQDHQAGAFPARPDRWPPFRSLYSEASSSCGVLPLADEKYHTSKKCPRDRAIVRTGLK